MQENNTPELLASRGNDAQQRAATFEYDAFISYRRQDATLAARGLRSRLLDFKLPASLQQFDNRSLNIYLDSVYERATEDFFESTIKPALAASRHLIVVGTPGARKPRAGNQPNWLVREIEYFLTLPQRRNISIALASGSFDDPLPGDLQKTFENIEVVDLRKPNRLRRPNWDDAIVKFVATLREIPQERMPELRKETQRRRAVRLRRWVIGGFVLASLLVGLLIYALISRAAAQLQAERARTALAGAEFQAAVKAIGTGQAATGLAHLAVAMRTRPQTVSARSLAAASLSQQRWFLPIEALRHEDGVLSAQFSPDGTRVVTASRDHTARVWDARTGAALGEPLRHEDAVLSAQFSPDGTRVVTASWHKTARVWDARTGAALGEPLQHGRWVHSAQFSPDGTRVVTASMDKTAQVWDARTGAALGEPLRHEQVVWSAQFSPDGTRVVTASEDNTARCGTRSRRRRRTRRTLLR